MRSRDNTHLRMETAKTYEQLLAEIRDLRARVSEAEEPLRAIRSGNVDAMVVGSGRGERLLAFEGAESAYRILIENMGEGALTLTPAGLVLYANRRFAEMLRAPLEQVIGSGIHTWFAPESRQVLQTLLRKDALDNRREELALVAADGTQVPIYLSVNRLLAGGMPESLCMIATDLTEQKRNAAMLAAERLARAIMEQGADAIVLCDETGRIIRASKAAQAFYGKNLLGQPFERAFPLRELSGTAFSPIGALHTNTYHSVEARLEYNGQGFALLVSVGHLKGARNELLGSVVTLTDITERKRAADELRESMNLLQLVVEHVPARIFWKDRDLRYLGCNTQFAKDAGHSRPDELTGKNDFEMGWKDQAELYRADDNAVLKSGASKLEIDEPQTTPDGTTIWLRTSKVPLRDKDSQTIGILGLYQDVTAVKMAESRINRLNRVYAVLSGINTLVVRVSDRDELFREACRIAVEHGQFKMAWIGIVDRSAMKIVPIAVAGAEPELLTLIKDQFPLRDDAPLGNSMSARAVRERKAIVSSDIRGDQSNFLAKELVGREIASMAILPLLVSDEAVGVLGLFAGEAGFFDDEEMKLLTDLAGDIAFAIDHIEKQERLDYLAYYDALTGLANRKLFLDRVTQYLRSAASGGHHIAVFMLDIERFRNINESLGRQAGDTLLRQAAEWLAHIAGDVNLIARLDADHFAAVMPEVDRTGDMARFVEEKLMEFQDHPFRLNDAVFRIGVKAGVALFPQDGADADELFRHADAALRNAKAGGERYLFYARTMTAAVSGQMTLESQLREALEKKEFVLHYQPKVSLETGKVTSAEALIRWNDPRTGLVPPGRFIPILEETGLIHEVGRWALHQAMADYLRWRAAGLPAVRIAVNVSALQLRDRGFVAEIEEAIGIAADAAAGLELEITESVIMADVKHNTAVLQAIRAKGVTIAIDDFGTGFSSLSYLAKLPVDTLKIDRSFIIDMTLSSQGLALVSTIINLAHSLRLKVVAEGVETAEQSRLLRLLRCDEMQGFFFSKPLPSEIFEARYLALPVAG